MNEISDCPGLENIFPTYEEEYNDTENVMEEEEIGPLICRVLAHKRTLQTNTKQDSLI